MPVSVAQLDARPTGDHEVAGSTSRRVGNILSLRLIMKYFYVILSLPQAQEAQLSVSGDRMCTILDMIPMGHGPSFQNHFLNLDFGVNFRCFTISISVVTVKPQHKLKQRIMLEALVSRRQEFIYVVHVHKSLATKFKCIGI